MAQLTIKADVLEVKQIISLDCCWLWWNLNKQEIEETWAGFFSGSLKKKIIFS